MSLENGSVLPPPRYSSHEFNPAFPQCSTSNVIDANPSTSTSNGEENTTATSSCSPTRCLASNKTPNSASVASLNHTSSPSPSYPSANSWPGFGGKNSRIDDIQATAVGSEMEDTVLEDIVLIDLANGQAAGYYCLALLNSLCLPAELTSQQSGERVFVFSSKMANEAIGGVQQNKYDSILAWHEANCQPSTSSGDQPVPLDTQQPAMAIKNKRKSTVSN
ncbi:hypothetical protein Tcan_06900 [Toxocara canis]|uniref:Uncharacterized protein n=1 Tax=Toxocara canis TaxID=6265 RepID=A0A0B2V5Q5_TOXCA|nr:hypothetical protein Tcan_06900 [Toxocara canis]